jgi:hypothetical protein
MGQLALPSLLAQATSPSLGAFVLSQGGVDWILGLLTGLALGQAVMVLMLWRSNGTTVES